MQFFTYYRMNNYFAIVDLIVEIQIQNTYGFYALTVHFRRTCPQQD